MSGKIPSSRDVRLPPSKRCDIASSTTINRRSVLTAGGLAIAATYWPMFGASAAPLKYGLSPTELSPGVWLISGVDEAINRGNGGAIANITILDTTEGAVIVDTGPSRRYGDELKKLARELTGKPVARVLLTHFHPDHVFGCQPFDKDALAAPKGVVDGLKQSGEDFASAMYHLAGDWMRGTAVTLPGKLIETGHEDIGERRLRYLVLAGHTDSDLAIFDERSGLLIAGDLAFLDRAPTTPHANLPTWHSSLATLTEVPFSRLVPGHGPAETTPRALRQTSDWLKMLDERITDAFERGLTMNEAMRIPMPSWTDKVALARYEFERSVMHIFPKLEAELWPRVDQNQ